ncbi:decapping enzyme, scavenger [Nomia melanderi]|uniref:decapping enzyme, scavenger n=1 Tax=Nomia melanderi TaxID=2448451 RepID=UPI001303F9D1|nr:m7GpppX diphosphatase [Nomia melanderi]
MRELDNCSKHCFEERSLKMAEVSVNTDGDACSPAKKAKLETENTSENVNNLYDVDICLSNFEVTKILDNNNSRKQICVQGVFKGHEGPSIIIFEKSQFSDDPLSLQKQLFNKETTLEKLYSNDIYGNYNCTSFKDSNGLHMRLIHPATQKHIDKFKKKELHIVDETYEIYKKVTLPHIESNNFSLQWVYNILEHKAEQENIIYEDKDEKIGFVLVNDLKWNGERNTLKLIALPFQRIQSMRELNASHLPLLKNIRDAGIKVISKKFNVPASQLRIYFHYQPSYYHLHVHFSYLMFETPGIYVEKAHLLSMVIRNLELMPDYYTKAVLSFVVVAGDPLYNKYLEEGILAKQESESNEVKSS